MTSDSIWAESSNTCRECGEEMAAEAEFCPDCHTCECDERYVDESGRQASWNTGLLLCPVCDWVLFCDSCYVYYVADEREYRRAQRGKETFCLGCSPKRRERVLSIVGRDSFATNLNWAQQELNFITNEKRRAVGIVP